MQALLEQLAVFGHGLGMTALHLSALNGIPPSCGLLLAVSTDPERLVMQVVANGVCKVVESKLL